MENKNDGLIKRGTEVFDLLVPTIGMFGGGTQPAKYFNKKGEEVPFEKTKWYQLKKRKENAKK